MFIPNDNENTHISKFVGLGMTRRKVIILNAYIEKKKELLFQTQDFTLQSYENKTKLS